MENSRRSSGPSACRPVKLNVLRRPVESALDASIRMMDQSRCGISAHDSHAERILAKTALEVVVHAPTDDLARCHILDGGQIQPAFIGHHIGDISQPDGIGRTGLKVSLQKVGRNSIRVLTVGGDGHPLFPSLRVNSVFFHKLGDTMTGNHKTFVLQGPMNARAPIGTLVGVENTADLIHHSGFSNLSCEPILSSSSPLVKPAPANIKNTAHRAHTMLALMGGDEAQFAHHTFSARLAKKTDAFCRISFSSLNRLFSRRRRCNSAASAF